MKRWLCLLLSLHLFPCLAIGSEEALILAQSGATSYRIVVPAGATEAVQHAAAELATYLERSTGAKFPVSGEAEAGEGPRIFVGWGDMAGKLAAPLDPESMGEEEFVMEAHPPHLLLAGGGDRGTLYAIYTFLEDQLGCRWFSSKVEKVPRHETLGVTLRKERRKPAFEYREPFAFDSFDADWAVRNKSNGHATRLDDKRGGKIDYVGFVHTFSHLVPPQEYFETHPEYYSLVGQKRSAHSAQLCLTNPDLLNLVTGKVVEMAREAPPSAILSVSQNDCWGWCECENCKAVEQEEGAVSGVLLRFVNAIAEEVAKVRPDVAIDTLAYQHSRKPPTITRPLPNVIVRLCSIECSFAHPLQGSAPNADFARDIEGWSKICQRLYIWDYVTDFLHYVQPHPNFRVLQPNLKFFAANGVKGVFEQGSYQSTGGEFQELRSWVLAKLLWDPGRDTEQLVDEFMDGYYGAAAPEVKKYWSLLHDSVQQTGEFLGCFSPTVMKFLGPEVMREADLLWSEAEKKVQADPDLLLRVRTGRLPVDYVLLTREATWSQTVPDWETTRSGEELRKSFFRVADTIGMTMVGEGRTYENFRAVNKLPRHRRAAPPPGYEWLPRDAWVDMQDNTFELIRPGVWVALQADAQSSDGVAARLSPDHTEWAVQFPLDGRELRQGEGRWHIFAQIRVELTGDEGDAFSYGLYDTEARKNLGGGTVKISEAKPRGYGMYDLGVQEAKPGRYLWVAPARNLQNITAVWVDRFIFVRPGF